MGKSPPRSPCCKLLGGVRVLTWPILLAMPVISDIDDDEDDEDDDFDEHIREGMNLRVTTASPLLGRILSLKALPTHGWDVDDGWAGYFELLGNWIDRDEFTMINNTPLVVSTWSGDK